MSPSSSTTNKDTSLNTTNTKWWAQFLHPIFMALDLPPLLLYSQCTPPQPQWSSQLHSRDMQCMTNLLIEDFVHGSSLALSFLGYALFSQSYHSHLLTNHTSSLTLSHTLTHSHTHTLTHSHTHTLTHSHTHTHPRTHSLHNLNTLLILSFQCMAAAMIILTFVDEGRINSLWGLFAAGCLLGGAAILGFITGFTLRPAAKALVCLPSLPFFVTISLSTLSLSLLPLHSLLSPLPNIN